jgi:hypothetical protein
MEQERAVTLTMVVPSSRIQMAKKEGTVPGLGSWVAPSL